MRHLPLKRRIPSDQRLTSSTVSESTKEGMAFAPPQAGFVFFRYSSANLYFFALARHLHASRVSSGSPKSSHFFQSLVQRRSDFLQFPVHVELGRFCFARGFHDQHVLKLDLAQLPACFVEGCLRDQAFAKGSHVDQLLQALAISLRQELQAWHNDKCCLRIALSRNKSRSCRHQGLRKRKMQSSWAPVVNGPCVRHGSS